MKRTEDSDHDCDVGFDTLVCEEADKHQPYQNRQQVSVSNMTPGRRGRLAAGILVLLAAVLLIVDISLGVHYNILNDNRLTTQDVERIENELGEFQDIYKTAIKSMNDANKRLENEWTKQIPTNWELDHMKRRKEGYEKQIATISKELESMRTHLPLISGGCRHCSPGWILMNSMCYSFHLMNRDGGKTWQKARQFCQMYGGDLLIADTRDKLNSTINYFRLLMGSQSVDKFWIGLNYLSKDDIWTWVDGQVLAEGFWRESHYDQNSWIDKCATLSPSENIFRAWDTDACNARLNWICEKASTSPN